MLRQFNIPSIRVLLFVLAIAIPRLVLSEDKSMDPVELGLEDSKPACEQSEITDYLTCIENYKEKLTKRDLITINDLQACVATRKNCLSTCRANMKRDMQCNIDKCPICPTVQLVEGSKRVVVEGENHSYKYDMPILPGQNITTIIKLTNVINNTNIVDIPTNINSTNVNNIYIYNNETSETGGDFGLGYNKAGSCCLAVQPKTCRGTSTGIRCRHKRHKTCGSQCTSRIIHAQSRQRCTRSTGCQQRVGYVPQPRSPRCVYTAEWPHVSCGGNYQHNCEGCYDHYGYGASNYYSGGRYPRHCSGCYDDAFDMGPLYRRGPVFRPFAYHQPPCYMTGTCGMPFCNYYGCYGSEYVDPAFGYGPHYAPDQAHYNQGELMDDDFEFTNEIERGETNHTAVPASDVNESWGVSVYKCKVVGDDGTIQIRNCTSNELDGNPFASSPSDYPYYPPQPNESPDYLEPNYRSPMYAKRYSEDGYHFANPRQDFVYDDYMTEESYGRSRRKAEHQRKWQAHNKRKVQIVYDEEENKKEQ